MVEDHASVWDVQLTKGLLGSSAGLQRRGGIRSLADGPTVGHLAHVADDGDELSFSLTICIHQFSEVSVRHLKELNLFRLRYQIGTFTGLDDGLGHLAGLRPSSTAQQAIIPQLMEALDDPAIPVTAIVYLVEPSFAQFGDPDIVIVLRAREAQWLFFVEAKVVSYKHSARSNAVGMQKTGFNSSINGQLSLRYRLARALSTYSCGQGELVEPVTLHSAAKTDLSDPARRARHLTKKANLTHLVDSQLVGQGSCAGALPGLLERTWFLALTEEPADSTCPLPTSPTDDLAPCYFGGEDAALADQAWRHTGWLSWRVLEDALSGLAEDSDYELVRALLKQPGLFSSPVGRAKSRSRGRTITSVKWSRYGSGSWVQKSRGSVQQVFTSAARALPRGPDLTVRQLEGSDSVVADGVVIGKIMAQGEGTSVRLMVGVAALDSVAIPTLFEEAHMLSGRDFRFISLTEKSATQREGELVRSVEEYLADVARA